MAIFWCTLYAVKKTVENCEKVILIEIQNGEWLKKKIFFGFLVYENY